MKILDLLAWTVAAPLAAVMAAALIILYITAFLSNMFGVLARVEVIEEHLFPPLRGK